MQFCQWNLKHLMELGALELKTTKIQSSKFRSKIFRENFQDTKVSKTQ